MCGAQALLAHRYRGFGPGIIEVLPLLAKWAETDVDVAQALVFQAHTKEQHELNTTYARLVHREIDKVKTNV